MKKIATMKYGPQKSPHATIQTCKIFKSRATKKISKFEGGTYHRASWGERVCGREVARGSNNMWKGRGRVRNMSAQSEEALCGAARKKLFVGQHK